MPARSPRSDASLRLIAVWRVIGTQIAIDPNTIVVTVATSSPQVARAPRRSRESATNAAGAPSCAGSSRPFVPRATGSRVCPVWRSRGIVLHHDLLGGIEPGIGAAEGSASDVVSSPRKRDGAQEGVRRERERQPHVVLECRVGGRPRTRCDPEAVPRRRQASGVAIGSGSRHHSPSPPVGRGTAQSGSSRQSRWSGHRAAWSARFAGTRGRRRGHRADGRWPAGRAPGLPRSAMVSVDGEQPARSALLRTTRSVARPRTACSPTRP